MTHFLNGGVDALKKPNTRKERVHWLISKLGRDYGWNLAVKTDHEVEKEFELMYQGFQDQKGNIHDGQQDLTCLICDYKVLWSCSCGCEDEPPIFSASDPNYESRLKAYEEEDERIHLNFLNSLSKAGFLDVGDGILINPNKIKDFDIKSGIVTFGDEKIEVSPECRASFIPFSK